MVCLSTYSTIISRLHLSLSPLAIHFAIIYLSTSCVPLDAFQFKKHSSHEIRFDALIVSRLLMEEEVALEISMAPVDNIVYLRRS